MNKEKVIVLYGARQVGKTTLCKKILKKYDGIFFNAEIQSVKEVFESKTPRNF